MSTPIPNSINTHPPVPQLQPLQGDPKVVAYRDEAVQICAKRYEGSGVLPPLTHDDVICIWSNPWCFVTEYLDAQGIREAIRKNKAFSALLLTSPTDEAAGIADLKRQRGPGDSKNPKKMKKDDQQGKVLATPKGPEPNKGDAKRNPGAKEQARQRDKHMCRWQWTPDPDITHLFPFAATHDDKSAAMTAACFEVTRHRFGDATYDEYLPLVSKPGALEMAANLQALGKSMHFWQDMGYLAFKVLNKEMSANGIWFVTIVLHWLPYLYPEDTPGTTADLTSGPSNTVIRARRQLDDAYRTGYRPRDAPVGDGVMKAFFQDRNEITSGRSVKFQHRSKEEAENFVTMVNYHWFGMSILTFRGVTKGLDPRSRPSGRGGGSGGGSNTRTRSATVPTSSSAPLPVGRSRGPGAGGHTPTGSIAPRGTNSPR
ncbi:uncharacterized protein B0J16DRAFT_390394 [Fusarium flagelliforme]|uniref:uncharacterized protein n=1 Tax=Fusarium flagelliforme TaxID=2675880 RepID=UPI001E8DD208|nr:uncharacterized protein B0J16DRAFT_390394 [Fusarium flagelliforme]KAH7196486.1 hypothetical protein B0J16DRAFT_390394 [Fusarium flagelliforme]